MLEGRGNQRGREMDDDQGGRRVQQANGARQATEEKDFPIPTYLIVEKGKIMSLGCTEENTYKLPPCIATETLAGITDRDKGHYSVSLALLAWRTKFFLPHVDDSCIING